jgi:hypothetical protein
LSHQLAIEVWKGEQREVHPLLTAINTGLKEFGCGRAFVARTKQLGANKESSLAERRSTYPLQLLTR